MAKTYGIRFTLILEYYPLPWFSQVCTLWRRAILNRDPYGRALYTDPVGERPSGAELQLAIDEMVQADNKELVETAVRGRRLLTKREDRSRVLSLIRAQTKVDPVKQAMGHPQSVELAGVRLRDEGARAAACALYLCLCLCLPLSLSLYLSLSLSL